MTERSISERAAIEDHRRVARESDEEARKLKLAADVLHALAGPLSDSTRDEIGEALAAIRRQRGEESEVAPHSPTSITMLIELAQAKDTVAAHADQAAGIAIAAEESATHIEAHGLPS